MDSTVEVPIPDSWHLYAEMYRCRLFEKEVKRLWLEGVIPGEMHLGTGEEAINVGIVDQLMDGDAMALDHRGTAPNAGERCGSGFIVKGISRQDLMV